MQDKGRRGEDDEQAGAGESIPGGVIEAVHDGVRDGVRGGRAEEHVPGDDDMQDQESSGYDDELDGACESVPDDEVQVGTGDGASGDAQDVRGNGGLADVQAGAGDEGDDVQVDEVTVR